VVYPPVAGESPRVPWAEREDGFVVIGRLVPEKGLPLIMDILSEVRKVKPVHLHIIGRRGRTSYARKIEDLCGRHADWVRLEGEMYGPEKEAFLARHKYGLSGCRSEAFGIAVAEMVKAGLVVWVPNGGGQTEIVADASLIFDGPDNAVTRILSVITGAERETSLRRHLEGRAAAFSPARFGEEMRAVARDFLTDGHNHGA
jgi:glycosyltransferase involved in cell wall biosynthesis